jgi:hypothetical protein
MYNTVAVVNTINSTTGRPDFLTCASGESTEVSNLKSLHHLVQRNSQDVLNPDLMSIRHTASHFVKRICEEAGRLPLDMTPFWDFFFASSDMEKTVESLVAENKRLTAVISHLAEVAS